VSSSVRTSVTRSCSMPQYPSPARGSGIGSGDVSDRLEIHIVSDSTGDTAARVGRAAQSQFVDTEVEMIRHARVQTREQLGPALNAITTASGREASLVPGRSAPLDAQYFRRIAAIEFAVKHDDGRGADDLHQADIVLIGVSRTSKTPTSMHLGYLGYMAANVPIVRGVDPPPVLFTVESWKLVGLTIDAEQLAGIRRRRVRTLAGAGARYADLAEIYEELEFTRALHKRLGCPVIDVTGLAIEETAARVAELVDDRRRAVLEGARGTTA